MDAIAFPKINWEVAKAFIVTGFTLPTTLTLIIGFIALCIAWQQHLTNKKKLVSDLFDRRFAIYMIVKDFLDNYAPGKYGAVTNEERRQFLRDIQPSLFLFGDDGMFGYLEWIAAQSEDLESNKYGIVDEYKLRLYQDDIRYTLQQARDKLSKTFMRYLKQNS